MKLFSKSMIVGALFCSTSAFANSPAWTISESSGTVNVLRPGVTEAGTRGKALKAGDVIATGKAGRAVLVRGGEYLVVSANSRIAIAQPKSGSMTQIVQSFGNAVFKIQKKTTPHFAVQTPYLAAVVKGTTFSVTVEEGGASVQVTEGRVEVSTTDGGASHLVVPGEIGLVRSGMPGRLMIKGDDTKTIDSPTPRAIVAPASPVSNDIAQAGDASAEPAAKEESVAVKIEEAIGEGAVDLGKMSDGMVTGNSTLVAMVTQPVPVQRPAAVDLAAPPADPAPAPAVEAPVTAVVDQLPAAPTPVDVVEPAPAVETPAPAPVVVADVVPLPAPAETPDVVASLPPVDVAAKIKDPDKDNGNGNGNDIGQHKDNGNGNDKDVGQPKDNGNGNDKDVGEPKDKENDTGQAEEKNSSKPKPNGDGLVKIVALIQSKLDESPVVQKIKERFDNEADREAPGNKGGKPTNDQDDEESGNGGKGKSKDKDD